MDAQARILEMAYRIDHRHPDGSWGEMVEDRSHQNPADNDPEKGWRKFRIFRCTSCDEEVAIANSAGIPVEER
jgi:hypothetical protein